MWIERLSSTLRLLQLGRGRPGPRASRPRNLVERIEQLAATCPDRLCLRTRSRSLSFGDWNEQANRVAHWSLRRGLVAGDVVAFYRAGPLEMLVGWVGLAKAGVVSALLPDSLRGAELESALELAAARYLICSPEELPAVARPSSGSDLRFEIAIWREPTGGRTELDPPAGVCDFGRELCGMPNANPKPGGSDRARIADPEVRLWTAAETGAARAIRFSHAALLAEGGRLAAAAGYASDDVLYSVLPLWHASGLVGAVGAALAVGASLVLPESFTPGRVLDDCRSFEVTSLHYSEEFARLLLFESPSDSDREHSLRTLVGSGLRRDLWEPLAKRFGVARILELHRMEDGRVALWNLEGRAGAIGRLPLLRLGGVAVIRVDQHSGQPERDAAGRCVECEVGEAGELVRELEQAGSGVRYLCEDHEAQTQLRGVRRSRDLWRRSGDLVRRDRDGFCSLLGRVSERIHWRGVEVFPEELAALLREFEGVRMAQVYGVEVPDEPGRAVMAKLVLAESLDFEADGFFEFVAGVVPAVEVPIFVRVEAEPDLDPVFGQPVRSQIEVGWDPDRSAAPIFVRDEERRTYERVTPMICALIRKGRRGL